MIKLYKISFVLSFGFPFYFKITLTNQILPRNYSQFSPNASHEENGDFLHDCKPRIVWFSLDERNWRIFFSESIKQTDLSQRGVITPMGKLHSLFLKYSQQKPRRSHR